MYKMSSTDLEKNSGILESGYNLLKSLIEDNQRSTNIGTACLSHNNKNNGFVNRNKSGSNPLSVYN